MSSRPIDDIDALAGLESATGEDLDFLLGSDDSETHTNIGLFLRAMGAAKAEGISDASAVRFLRTIWGPPLAALLERKLQEN